MSERLEAALEDCGCCAPAAPPTPASPIPTSGVNSAGRSALAYRVGDHSAFLEAMRAGAAEQGALRGLRTREPDDPAVALLDAWAATLDVLSFYTERIANEAYLRTATETLSIIELARTVGYERGPGRASETLLAFTLEDSPGSPPEVPVPLGTRVASLPGPGETPQTFETVADLLARPERNALTARTRAPRPPSPGRTTIHLAGAATALRPGDQLLIVGRDDSPSTGRWLLRTVRQVAVSGASGQEVTEVGWDEPLGEGRAGAEEVPAPEDVRVYALRLRTSLFGANAPDWRVIPDTVQEHYEGEGGLDSVVVSTFAVTARSAAVLAPVGKVPVEKVALDGPDDWPGFTVVPPGAAANTVDLDGDRPEVGAPSWLVLQRGTTVALYEVRSATALSRSDYAMSGKVTRVLLAGGPDVATAFAGGLRTTIALGASQRLDLADAPIAEPVHGRSITLAAGLEPPLAPGQPVVVTGPRPRLVVADGVHTLVLVTATGATTGLFPGEPLVVVGAPIGSGGDGLVRTWPVRRLADGTSGTVAATADQLLAAPPGDGDEVLSELATVSEPSADAEVDRLDLASDLAGVFDRAAIRVAANVVPASHGETRAEILGSGDAASSFQRFRLAQAPLTHRVGPTGAFSTLVVRVDGLQWTAVPSLAVAGPRDRVYAVRADEDGKVTVTFGDGTSGARLPTGQENVSATYRVGTGLAGVLPAGRLTMLLTRPLGVRSVTNPLPTGIAADADPPDLLRRNAPRTALTFDRVVSLTDFADFARATPGIAKASATWHWLGEARVVQLIVAGDAGQPVDAQARADLTRSIRSAGDPRQPFVVVTVDLPTFDVGATLIVDPRLLPGTVKAACVAALAADFGFDARALGQAVTASEVVASAHRVPGVIAVTLTSLVRSGGGTSATGGTVETVLLAAPTEVLMVRTGGIGLIEATS